MTVKKGYNDIKKRSKRSVKSIQISIKYTQKSCHNPAPTTTLCLAMFCFSFVVLGEKGHKGVKRVKKRGINSPFPIQISIKYTQKPESMAVYDPIYILYIVEIAPNFFCTKKRTPNFTRILGDIWKKKWSFFAKNHQFLSFST